MVVVSPAAIAISVANLVAFAVYGFDKAQARANGPRVSEGALILLAMAGGIGAWLGCELFRHKTRKQPFRGYLIAAICVHIAIIFVLLAFTPD